MLIHSPSFAAHMSFAQVYIAAITGHVPSDMVKCLSAFMEACYIIRRDRITASDLERFRGHFTKFQQLRSIFIRAGVRVSVAPPRQHAMSHYYSGIELFGSPNGLCSSITESKHIQAVK